MPAEANAGKTTLFFSLAGDMAKAGYNVYYVNSDVSGGDAKYYISQAKDMNITLMLPDMKTGVSMNSIVESLITMTEDGHTFNDEVFIFDTLKKMMNVINKSQAKDIFKLLRKLTARGMTIILLAHTNKYKDEDGMPIYEGTGDLRSDVDDLIYILPKDNDDGSKTITTYPNKQRGSFESISYLINKDRKITKLGDAIDVFESKRLADELGKDQAGIDCIKSAIADGNPNQRQIIEKCKGIGDRIIKKLLIKYSPENEEASPDRQYWNKNKGTGKSYEYSLIN